MSGPEHSDGAPSGGQLPASAYSIGPPPPPGVRRLHLNEYRFPHAPSVGEELRRRQAAPIDDLLTQYQGGSDPSLVEALAHYVGAASPKSILVAAGSDEVLRAVLETSRGRGHAILLMGIPGYTHFEHYARLQGLEIMAYPIGLSTSADDHEASLRYYSDHLSAGCLVYLCSPNNPTGDLWDSHRVEALATAFPKSLFLVDEAYVEFASAEAVLRRSQSETDGATPEECCSRPDSWLRCAAALNTSSLAQLAISHDNIVVTRTFSKAFGLAALRVGYAVGTQATIASLAVAVSPKAFNPIAAPVARKALFELKHYYKNALAARREAKRATAALRAKGWWALDTPGNFYLVYVEDVRACMPKLTAQGVQVRDRDDLPGLAGFVRITAGTREDSDAVVAAFAALQAPKDLPPQLLYTPKGTVALIKVLMKRTLALLRYACIPVWAQGGTMLGVFRHRTAHIDGGMLPWDDDGDLAYYRPTGEPDPLGGLVQTFALEGLALQRNRTDAYWQVGTNRPGEKISPVHIDIFSYHEEQARDGEAPRYLLDDERFRREDPNAPRADCNTSYSRDELFPLSYNYRFYDLIIAMPAQAEKVLRRALGENFMTEAKVRTQEGGLVCFPVRDKTAA